MLQFVYDFEPANDRSWLYSTKLIDSLLFHKGKGGLYQNLKDKGYVEQL